MTEQTENFSSDNDPPIRPAQPAASSLAPLSSSVPVAQHPATAGASAGDRAQAVRQPAREPDEIHIHIGRVEVAALAQPALRQASPAAPRKSINLDEYLRRGNGRAR